MKLKKYFIFDDEYLTGHDFHQRLLMSAILWLFIIGFYIQTTTFFKRSKSLGHNDITSSIFAFFGGLLLPIMWLCDKYEVSILYPLAAGTLIFWYLWWFNGVAPVKYKKWTQKAQRLETRGQNSLAKENYEKALNYLKNYRKGLPQEWEDKRLRIISNLESKITDVNSRNE